MVFSGVFCLVWIGEAAVTLQIKLLGGKMYVHLSFRHCPRLSCTDVASTLQFLLSVNLHHRLHPFPSGHCRASQCAGAAYSRQNPCLSRPRRMVSSCRSQHLGRLGHRSQPSGHCRVPALHVLYRDWMSLFH